MSPSIEYLLSQHKEAADKITRYLNKSQKEIETKRAEIEELEMFTKYDGDLVDQFFKFPYVVLPRRKGESYLIVPKFFNISVGHLLHSNESYNIFVVSKFAHYLGSIPRALRDVFEYKESLPLKVFDGVMLTGEDHQAEAWERYSPFLTRRDGKDKIRVKDGSHFDLLAALIDDGILPFIPKPVDPSHFQKAVWLKNIDEIDRRRNMSFFKDAVKAFFDTGAIGLFWAMGVGKTLYGLEALASVKVGELPNLVVSGKSSGLRQQWKESLELIEPAAKVEIYTYQKLLHKNFYPTIKDRKFGLVIFDEAHHLPAKTFSRLSTLNAEYRIGLSATPYREDGKSQYIFALTGNPIGLNWRVLIDLDLIKEPNITVWICKDYAQKKKKLRELLAFREKTLVYSWDLDIGHDLSKTFDIPFVYGATPVKQRLEIIRQSLQTIVSAVGKEGLSFRGVRRTITYSFFKGSRQEEVQFLGRLLHGQEEDVHHDILMTEDEEDQFGKRIFGVEEHFKVKIVRLGGTYSRGSPTKRKTQTRTPRAPRQKPVKAPKPKPVVDTSEFPLLKELDDRDDFNKHYEKMIFAILRSDYAKSGLEVGIIRQVLEFHNIKFTYRKLRDRMTSLYKSRKIGSRKNQDGKRVYFME